MNLRNRTNCNTSNTKANELHFSVNLGTSLCLGFVWVQISRTFKNNKQQENKGEAGGHANCASRVP